MSGIERLITDSQRLIKESNEVRNNLKMANQQLNESSKKIFHLTHPSRTGKNASAQVNQAAKQVELSMSYINDLESQLDDFVQQRLH